jgi:Protein of unknown function (DUF3617)
MNPSMLAPALFASVLAVAPSGARPATTPGGETTIKPGLWEMTATIENPSASSKRSVVGRTCIGTADASNLARIVPAQQEFGLHCENSDLKREGTNVVWAISCKSSDATQIGKGRMSFFGDSYLGTADVELRKKGSKPVKLTQSFSGKWLQACS